MFDTSRRRITMEKKNPNNRTRKASPQRKKQPPKKAKARTVINSIIIVFLSVILIGGVSGFFMLGKIVSSVSAKNLSEQLVNKEPSIFYASDGKTIIGEVGGVSRENVTYNQIPQSTIDAFLSIEDSRYFKHNGFDLPRFISSALNNVRSASFSQGGSTLTMQMIDNFIMKPAEEKAIEDGKPYSSLTKVEKKIQEIYLSMRAEKELSKEEIITKYLNEINFGDSARGIQRGAQYYFNKNVEDLTLSESAFLAGVINAPNSYNPYRGYDESTDSNYYAYAEKRRNITLSQMLNHGYITKTEYNLAKSTKLAFQLGGEKKSKNNYEQYRDFVYQAQLEVRKLTGSDPATVPMKIYTSLDIDAQKKANDIAAGEEFNLPSNKYYQLGTATLNNNTGEIIAVIGGRTDIESKSDTFKTRFTEERQPGSSIKPLLDYAPTFDKLGWATSRIIEDSPIKIDGNVSIPNADGKYYGDVTMEYAIAKSLNTPALRALQALMEKEGNDSLISYLKSLGFTEKVANEFNTQYGVGGSGMQASPVQMAAAYAAFANGGYYIEPHMITKVEYKDGSKTIDNKPKKTQVMSPQAAYMTSELLYEAVNGKHKGENLMGSLGFGKYPVYGKTGTTNYDENEKNGYGGLMKDEWMVNYTSEYTVATWTGFDQSVKGKDTAINNYLYDNINGKVNKSLLDAISSNAIRIQNPGGISSYGGGLIKTEWLSSAAKNNPKTSKDASVKDDGLQSAISGAEKISADEYTSESYAKLQQALAAARKVLANAQASQSDIDGAKAAIESAMQGLVKKPAENKTDSTILNTAISNAANYQDTTKYNPLQVSSLQTAVSEGNAILSNSSATQEQIDAAADKIQAAIQDCINNPVTPTPTPTPPEGETPSTGDGGTTPNAQ